MGYLPYVQGTVSWMEPLGPSVHYAPSLPSASACAPDECHALHPVFSGPVGTDLIEFR